MAWDEYKFIGKNNSANAVTTAAVVANRDGTLLERSEWIINALGGAQARFEQSISASVEEDAYLQFTITIFDLDAGAVASASIDITSISNVMSKGTAAGAAFSAVGTQPTFAKSNGLVTCSYRFLAAEWAVGDVYRLVVGGITATVDGETVYIPDMVWSNLVVEAADVTARIGAYTGDGGADQNDSVKASLDLVHTQLSYGVVEIEADTGTTSTIIIDAAALTQGTDDWWKRALLISINGQNAGQTRPVVSFSQAADTVTVYPAFLNTPDVGDDFLLVSSWCPWVWDQLPDVSVTINAINASETDIFDLNDSISSYMINSLRIKCADPGANTVAVKLYELINDVSVNVQTFTIDTNNFAIYFSLVDMFGMAHLAGDDIQVTVQASAGGPYAITGQYQYAISKNG